MGRPFSTVAFWRRLAAWLGLCAMLVPLWVSLVHHPVSVAASVPSAPRPMTAMVGMDAAMPGCPGMGQAYGKATPDIGTSLPAKKPVPVKTCPICQQMQVLSAGFVPPLLVAALLRIRMQMAVRISASQISLAIATLVPPHARPRAPPLV